MATTTCANTLPPVELSPTEDESLLKYICDKFSETMVNVEVNSPPSSSHTAFEQRMWSKILVCVLHNFRRCRLLANDKKNGDSALLHQVSGLTKRKEGSELLPREIAHLVSWNVDYDDADTCLTFGNWLVAQIDNFFLSKPTPTTTYIVEQHSVNILWDALDATVPANGSWQHCRRILIERHDIRAGNGEPLPPLAEPSSSA